MVCVCPNPLLSCHERAPPTSARPSHVVEPIVERRIGRESPAIATAVLKIPSSSAFAARRSSLALRPFGQLLKAIKGTDDYTRKAFMEYGRYNSVQDLPSYSGQFDNVEEDDDYPDPADDDRESLWIQNLLELRQGARLVAAEFKKSRGAERSAPIDTLVWIARFGSGMRSRVGRSQSTR